MQKRGWTSHPSASQRLWHIERPWPPACLMESGTFRTPPPPAHWSLTHTLPPSSGREPRISFVLHSHSKAFGSPSGTAKYSRSLVSRKSLLFPSLLAFELGLLFPVSQFRFNKPDAGGVRVAALYDAPRPRDRLPAHRQDR